MPRLSWILLIILLAGLLLSRESRRPGPVSGIDRAFFDWLSANTHPGAAASALGGTVTLVEIDDSVLETPGRWPLSPLDYALFLQAVQKFDPAVIAIEPVLNWSHAQPGNEEILINQALTAPKLLLGAELGSAQGAPDAAALPGLEHVTGNPAAIPDFPEIVAAPTARLFPLAVCGITNLPPPGSPIREIPLVFRRRGDVLASFTLQALGLWLRLAPEEISVTLGRAVELGEQRSFAIDRAGCALLDASVFPRVNRIELDDLMLLTSGPPQGPSALAAVAARIKGGLVVLGRTDRTRQVYTLPGSRRASAAEVLAWGAQSLRDRPTLRRAGPGWDIWLTLAGVVLTGVLLQVGSRRLALSIAAAALGIYALTALGVFEWSGLWLPGALPGGLVFCAVACRFLFINEMKTAALR